MRLEWRYIKIKYYYYYYYTWHHEPPRSHQSSSMVSVVYCDIVCDSDMWYHQPARGHQSSSRVSVVYCDIVCDSDTWHHAPPRGRHSSSSLGGLLWHCIVCDSDMWHHEPPRSHQSSSMVSVVYCDIVCDSDSWHHAPQRGHQSSSMVSVVYCDIVCDSDMWYHGPQRGHQSSSMVSVVYCDIVLFVTAIRDTTSHQEVTNHQVWSRWFIVTLFVTWYVTPRATKRSPVIKYGLGGLLWHCVVCDSDTWHHEPQRGLQSSSMVSVVYCDIVLFVTAICDTTSHQEVASHQVWSRWFIVTFIVCDSDMWHHEPARGHQSSSMVSVVYCDIVCDSDTWHHEPQRGHQSSSMVSVVYCDIVCDSDMWHHEPQRGHQSSSMVSVVYCDIVLFVTAICDITSHQEVTSHQVWSRWFIVTLFVTAIRDTTRHKEVTSHQVWSRWFIVTLFVTVIRDTTSHKEVTNHQVWSRWFIVTLFVTAIRDTTRHKEVTSHQVWSRWFIVTLFVTAICDTTSHKEVTNHQVWSRCLLWHCVVCDSDMWHHEPPRGHQSSSTVCDIVLFVTAICDTTRHKEVTSHQVWSRWFIVTLFVTAICDTTCHKEVTSHQVWSQWFIVTLCCLWQRYVTPRATKRSPIIKYGLGVYCDIVLFVTAICDTTSHKEVTSHQVWSRWFIVTLCCLWQRYVTPRATKRSPVIKYGLGGLLWHCVVCDSDMWHRGPPRGRQSSSMVSVVYCDIVLFVTAICDIMGHQEVTSHQVWSRWFIVTLCCLWQRYVTPRATKRSPVIKYGLGGLLWHCLWQRYVTPRATKRSPIIKYGLGGLLWHCVVCDSDMWHHAPQRGHQSSSMVSVVYCDIVLFVTAICDTTSHKEVTSHQVRSRWFIVTLCCLWQRYVTPRATKRSPVIKYGLGGLLWHCVVCDSDMWHHEPPRGHQSSSMVSVVYCDIVLCDSDTLHQGPPRGHQSSSMVSVVYCDIVLFVTAIRYTKGHQEVASHQVWSRWFIVTLFVTAICDTTSHQEVANHQVWSRWFIVTLCCLWQRYVTPRATKRSPVIKYGLGGLLWHCVVCDSDMWHHEPQRGHQSSSTVSVVYCDIVLFVTAIRDTTNHQEVTSHQVWSRWFIVTLCCLWQRYVTPRATKRSPVIKYGLGGLLWHYLWQRYVTPRATTRSPVIKYGIGGLLWHCVVRDSDTWHHEPPRGHQSSSTVSVVYFSSSSSSSYGSRCCSSPSVELCSCLRHPKDAPCPYSSAASRYGNKYPLFDFMS